MTNGTVTPVSLQEKIMRALLSGFVAASLLTSQIAAADPCARSADKTAFDVAGLKSQLMVTALTCNAQDRYNAFIVRYQPELRVQEKALNAYFARSFGRRAQQEHDSYITNLANAQSEIGLRRGTLFCRENVGLFDEVLTLPKGVDLASFAGGKSLTQPAVLVACAGPERVIRTAQVQQVVARTKR